MIQIVLADDHIIVRDGLKRMLQDYADLHILGEAATAAEVLTALAALAPDVVVLDIKLPDGNGLGLIPKIKAHRAACKVLMLSMYDQSYYARCALESGADGYVVKGSSIEDLVQAIRTVHGGGTYVSPKLAAQLIGTLKTGKAVNPLDTLSQREFQVLSMMAGGLSGKEAAAQLDISIKSVSTYQTRLLEKLGLHSKSELIRFAIDHGIV